MANDPQVYLVDDPSIHATNIGAVYSGPNTSYTLSVGSNDDDVYSLSNGAQSVRLYYQFANQSLFILSYDSVVIDFFDNIASVDLSGGNGRDQIRSGSGNDTLNGGGGNDVLEGGTGTNTIDGGDGINTVSYEHYQIPTPAPFGIIVDLQSNLAKDGLLPADNATFDSLTNIQNIRGSAFDDVLVGDGNNNIIEGGAGSDDIRGNGGSDTASYEHAGTGVVAILANAGSNTGDASGDRYSNIANLLGSAFNDTLTGDANNNTITGGAGNDYLEGGAGNDTLIGGAGNDAYILRADDSPDIITEDLNGGTDTVRSAVSLTLADNVERVQLVGKVGLFAYGNELKNTIAGNTADNTLDGKAGSDVLTGFGGNDTFAFTTALGSTNVDRITDFNLNDAGHHDTLLLEPSIFAAVGFKNDGTLKDGEFVTIDKTHKPTADAHLFYNSDKGALYYDADGYYGHQSAAVQVAVFDGKPLLTAADFFEQLGG